MLLHAKSPLSFLGGAVFSLFLLYLWRISSFGFDIDPYLEGKATQKMTVSEGNFSVISNETIAEPVVEKYSIQDVLSNSTLGVSPIVVAEVKLISPPNSSRKSWRSTFHRELTEVTY